MRGGLGNMRTTREVGVYTPKTKPLIPPMRDYPKPKPNLNLHLHGKVYETAVKMADSSNAKVAEYITSLNTGPKCFPYLMTYVANAAMFMSREWAEATYHFLMKECWENSRGNGLQLNALITLLGVG